MQYLFNSFVASLLVTLIVYQPLYAAKLDGLIIAQQKWRGQDSATKKDSTMTDTTQGDYSVYNNTSRSLTVWGVQETANHDALLLANHTYVNVEGHFWQGFFSGFFVVIGPIMGIWNIKGSQVPVYMGYRIIKDQGEEYFREFLNVYKERTEARKERAFSTGAVISTSLVVVVSLIVKIVNF